MGGVDGPLVHALAIYGDNRHPVGVDDVIQLPPQALDLQHQAADLHAAGCGTGAAAHIHQQHQNTPAEGGPQGEVLGGVAGGAHDGGSLKRRVGDGFIPALSQLHVQVDADQADGSR